MSPIVRHGPSAGLVRFLRRDRHLNVYPLFQMLRRRRVRAWSVENASGHVVAALIEGAQALLPYVPDSWLVADDGAAFAILAAFALQSDISGTMTIAAKYEEIADRIGLPGQREAERHLILSGGPASRADPEEPCPIRLSGTLVQMLSCDEQVLDLIGRPERFPDPSWYFALVLESRIAAILDASVTTPDTVAIQQMYVAPAWRRRGLGSKLLSAVCRCAAARGQSLSYITSASNVAALGMVKRCRFRPRDERLCVSMPSRRAAG